MVKAFSIPDELYAKLLVMVSASDVSKPLTPDNPIKMTARVKKEFGNVSSTKTLRSGDLFIECKSVSMGD